MNIPTNGQQHNLTVAYKEKSRHPECDPDAVSDFIDTMIEVFGEEKLAEQIVAVAETQGHSFWQEHYPQNEELFQAIHKFFTWDTARAAAAWNREEARKLIRCVVLVYDDGNNEKLEVQAHINTDNESESSQGYKSKPRILNEGDLRDQHLNELRKELQRLKGKYAQYEAFHQIVIEELGDILSTVAA